MSPLQLADRHGRVATDLRVSVTDRCNLRCAYCNWMRRARATGKTP